MILRRYPVTIFTVCTAFIAANAMARAAVHNRPEDRIFMLVPAALAVMACVVWLLEKRDSHADNARTQQEATEQAEDGPAEGSVSRISADLPYTARAPLKPLSRGVVDPLSNAQQQQAQTDSNNGAILSDASGSENGNACDHHAYPPVVDFDAAHSGPSQGPLYAHKANGEAPQ